MHTVKSLKAKKTVLKYPIFINIYIYIYIYICFMHTVKSLKVKKKSYCIFIQQRKLQKICFSMHFGFNNQFIKVTRT